MGRYNTMMTTGTGKTVASNSKANAGLVTGIIGTSLGTMALINQNNCGKSCNNGGLLSNLLGGGCNNECYVDEKEFAWAQGYNALQAELAKEKSERYADSVGLSLYEQLVAERKEIDAAQNDGFRLLFEAFKDQEKEVAVLQEGIKCLTVVNEKEHDAIANKAAFDVQLESERRECGDQTILNYVKSNYIKGTLKLDADDICPEVQLKCPDVQLVQLLSRALLNENKTSTV